LKAKINLTSRYIPIINVRCVGWEYSTYFILKNNCWMYLSTYYKYLICYIKFRTLGTNEPWPIKLFKIPRISKKNLLYQSDIYYIAHKYIVNWNTQELVNSFYNLYNVRLLDFWRTHFNFSLVVHISRRWRICSLCMNKS